MGVAVCWMFTRCGKKRKGLGGGAGYHPLPCFLQEYDSMGVRWWGCAKDVILKGIMAIDERRGGAKGVGGSVWVRERVFLNAEFTESAEKKRGEAGCDGG